MKAATMYVNCIIGDTSRFDQRCQQYHYQIKLHF